MTARRDSSSANPSHTYGVGSFTARPHGDRRRRQPRHRQRGGRDGGQHPPDPRGQRHLARRQGAADGRRSARPAPPMPTAPSPVSAGTSATARPAAPIANPSHLYTNPGNYTVTLTATDDSGDTGSTTDHRGGRSVQRRPGRPPGGHAVVGQAPAGDARSRRTPRPTRTAPSSPTAGTSATARRSRRPPPPATSYAGGHLHRHADGDRRRGPPRTRPRSRSTRTRTRPPIAAASATPVVGQAPADRGAQLGRFGRSRRLDRQLRWDFESDGSTTPVRREPVAHLRRRHATTATLTVTDEEGLTDTQDGEHLLEREPGAGRGGQLRQGIGHRTRASVVVQLERLARSRRLDRQLQLGLR